MIPDCLYDLKSLLPGAWAWGRAPIFGTLFLSLPNRSQIYKLWGLIRKEKKKHICFFLNWCRFPDGIRSHYWLRRNTCLWGPQIWQMVHFEYLKQINKAFSVFADTHYPVLLELCQMQTPKANFSSFCSVPNLCKELHWWESLSFVLLCLWTYGPTVVYWWVKLHMAAR